MPQKYIAKAENAFRVFDSAIDWPTLKELAYSESILDGGLDEHGPEIA